MTIQNPEFLAAVQDAAVRKALQDFEFMAALSRFGPTGACGGGCMAALESPQLWAALENADFARKLADAGLSAALAGEAFRTALAARGFRAALQDARFAAAIETNARAAH